VELQQREEEMVQVAQVQQVQYLTQLLLLYYKYLWQAVKQELLVVQEEILVHQ
jgi:hypothetical protein